MIKKALIIGISGQDGSYLAEHLQHHNYKVYGIVRRHSVAENQNFRISSLKNIKTYYGDLLDSQSIIQVIKKIKPTEIYNLGAMSQVQISFDIPKFTIETNGLALVDLLEYFKKDFKDVKFYQASSSEMFGNSIEKNGFQKLTTNMQPVSPYGCAKLLAYNLVNHYRKAYGLFLCNGILFNHESPRRGSNFISTKIIKAAVEIKKGIRNKLEVGNLDSYRDWGHSKDYVKAMWLILNYKIPRNWVVATGKSYSVRDLITYVFKQLDLNFNKHVVVNQKYIRPHELNFLRGDSRETRSKLKWKPSYTFEGMINEMLNYWIENYKLQYKK
jgi:GDPmannose 4,6-dehydratase